MNITKWNNHPLFTGTVILTATGLASRVIGFLYRIFLSHTIGAEGLGIYQLVFPILTLCLALCTGGIQTAISKYTAESEEHAPLYCGICVCMALSACCTFVLYRYAPWLAKHIVSEPACEPLLRIISLSLPFACLHACFNGYYYGKNKTAIPAISQLFEQIVRVFSVYLFYLIVTEKSAALTPALAMWGTVCGEVASALFCLTTFQFRRCHLSLSVTKRLICFATPLTGSRVILNLFASAEAILIPSALTTFGLGRSDALSVFGTLTGMAMPVIMLPTVLTGSLSVLLLPAISEAAAKGDRRQIAQTIRRTVELCVILGLACTLAYLLFGRFVGSLLFRSSLAGSYIVSLGFMCPFLFLSGTLSSILHGLNLTLYTFLLNLMGCGIRLFAIYFLVPRLGLYVYLWSMLLSQLIQAAAYLWILSRIGKHRKNPALPG
ncbi:MAG: polysaccharide biosynthesis protein [Lachnospiraceae bacterium]|nr:polysaccharide biosynthesis protein [Lachnospiraceae bacterium]